MPQDNRYSPDEMKAILRKAVERREVQKEPSDSVSHDELVETAKEVGIDPRELEAAAIEVRREREQSIEREGWADEKRAQLRRSATAWAVVSTLAFALNFFLGPPWWFLAVLGPWGALVALRAVRLGQGPSKEELEARRQKRLREARRQEVRASLENGAQAVGMLMSEGVKAVMAKIDESKELRDWREQRGLNAPKSDQSKGNGGGGKRSL